MSTTKNLSNPYSSGGGGVHFESAVQACFVTLMLTGGYAPCLPQWPVVEVQVQGKIEGYETDDLIVLVEDPSTGERRRLLGQVKHSITFTQRDQVLGEVLAAAWADFNNPAQFKKGADAIALITGPLSATDQRVIRFLLAQARRVKDAATFYRNVRTAKFSPAQAEEKLAAIEAHLQTANGGTGLTDEQVVEFLRHFSVLGYDLDDDIGVARSLLHSHISQFDLELPGWAWPRIVEVVQAANRSACAITKASLPEDLRLAFQVRATVPFPDILVPPTSPSEIDWSRHPDAKYLVLALLLGSWREDNEYDVKAVAALLGIDYTTWLDKARSLINLAGSPLSVHNGLWTISNRQALWAQLGSHMLDSQLTAFRDLAVSVLRERDPAFDLPPEERYAANIRGKVTAYSPAFRMGLAEGLTILGIQPEAATHCSLGKPEATAFLSVEAIFIDADWVMWGSLNSVLPTLAEASPRAFLDAVEHALTEAPSPFDMLFVQEGDGLTGGNYLTGLLWALEGIAWDPDMVVRAAVALGELASHDPGGTWANRPSNSLALIFLPWLPQTLATVEKRLGAVRTVLAEQPAVGWKLLIQLLPGRQTMSTGTHKPKWRTLVPESWRPEVSRPEYAEQIEAYAALALEAAHNDAPRLAELASRLADLPPAAFRAYLQHLASPGVASMAEATRSQIWNALTRFARRHRRFPDARWALRGEMLDLVETAAKALAPESPFELYRYLFNENDSDLFEERGNYEAQRQQLQDKRDTIAQTLLATGGIEGIIRLAETVRHPNQIGLALAATGSSTLDLAMLPHLLDVRTGKRHALAAGYIWRRFRTGGYAWASEQLSGLQTAQEKSRFLAELPFGGETWQLAADVLGEQQRQYWAEVQPNPYPTEGDLGIAIAKLLEAGRPEVAVECLDAMRFRGSNPDPSQVVKALLTLVEQPPAPGRIDSHNVVELIKYLQSNAGTVPDDLFAVEWAYLPLLGAVEGAQPKLLERRLSTDPAFFAQILALLYRADTGNQDAATSESGEHGDGESTEEAAQRSAMANNAWRLLHDWRIPPGMVEDSTIDAEAFRAWLDDVRTRTAASGHLQAAMIHVGEVLIHAPADPTGLWINRSVAAALNGRDAQSLRDGFRTGLYNSRGVHFVDPTGQHEHALAAEYREKGESVEAAGFQRLAVTLRELANLYERDASRIVASHGREGDN